MTVDELTVEEAADLVASGGIVGVPTETVYGIAADPRDDGAVARLFELKGRDRDKPIALLGTDAGAFSKAARVDGLAAAMGGRHWPGPLTLVVPMRKAMAVGVGDAERGTVGIRVPDHPVALELLAATGPLAVTSANPSGGPDAIDDVAARQALGDAVDGYLVGSGSAGRGSTVVDITVRPPVILRQGPLRLRF